VIVLGGGIIGLSCAYECRKRGYKVTVLETGVCGGQASGAAAGMLAPFSENGDQPDPFFLLSLESLRLYPEWVREIREVSGTEFSYVKSGSLYVIYHEADILALRSRRRWQNEYGADGELISADELLRLEPHVSRSAVGALYCPHEAHVYAPDFVKALEQACRVIGVTIADRLERTDIAEWERGIAVLSADGRKFTADRLVVCAGAWSGLMERTFSLSIPVYPIRGQICAYETPHEPVRHMVFCSQGYVVAKQNGTLVCGASEDVAGFDASVTEQGIARLEKWNRQLYPFLASMTPFHKWAGLRPATQDGYPLIGPLRRSEAVLFATGHYRNGILLSPVTAKIIADFMDGRTYENAGSVSGASPYRTIPLDAFAPERFTI